MNKVWVPTLIAMAALSTSAFADDDWNDGDRWEHRHHHRVERVVVQEVYAPPRVVYQAAPQVVYQAPPQVVYRDRVVYRETPVYYESVPRYDAPPPRYYEEPQPAPSYNGNRVMGQALGAVAGGVIGNQFGKGRGRVVATAAGAVLGSVVGANVAGYGY
jgi:hypothetical protein